MRVVLQRVKEASVTIDGNVHGQIQQGYMALVGICEEDNQEIVAKLAKKTAELRVFSDADDKMNLGIQDVNGAILSISQFTLYADCKKGRRPSFVKAAKPAIANPLYEYFNDCIRGYGIHVETGIFGADMKVSLINDGPVTIILDSNEM